MRTLWGIAALAVLASCTPREEDLRALDGWTVVVHFTDWQFTPRGAVDFWHGEGAVCSRGLAYQAEAGTTEGCTLPTVRYTEGDEVAHCEVWISPMEIELDKVWRMCALAPPEKLFREEMRK